MTDTKTTTTLHDPPVPVRAKLAAAWTSFMFLYIYVDYLHLYKPGAIDDILAGVVFEFDISQTFVVIALMLVAIPILMILLSMTLPARANRTLNLVVASLYIPVSAFNVVGESWIVLLRPRRRARSDRSSPSSSAPPGPGPARTPTLQMSRWPTGCDSKPTPEPSVSTQARKGAVVSLTLTAALFANHDGARGRAIRRRYVLRVGFAG